MNEKRIPKALAKYFTAVQGGSINNNTSDAKDEKIRRLKRISSLRKRLKKRKNIRINQLLL
ncbi:hypothetical protein HMPREF1042_1063 [Streptococcus constellatus subsp. pharyngis SK1060 = CCUG 46377]|uniref:Uncharacterized protein n=1 Tax=Streptococcus constellatus subsp. pharyngis SK1060 = CCUG 46377 TaxID=1035184 RepID=F9P6G3_STRCV|nr:hypothetical protein HMPREF1042_1063 [Streptococcus constellatus subsp. pharyngis SK1060 = CCUG 46377]